VVTTLPVFHLVPRRAGCRHYASWLQRTHTECLYLRLGTITTHSLMSRVPNGGLAICRPIPLTFRAFCGEYDRPPFPANVRPIKRPAHPRCLDLDRSSQLSNLYVAHPMPDAMSKSLHAISPAQKCNSSTALTVSAMTNLV
jgi:hypothetical protein